MNEITIEGKTYISSRRAAEITGYAKDYVSQLCRDGYVEATMVGRSWYVLESSIKAHRFGKTDKKKETEDEKTLPTDTKEDTWVPAVYVAEPLPAVIPVMQVQSHTVSVPKTILWDRSTVTMAPPVQENVLPSMQEAWQEWFASNTQRRIETEEVIEERNNSSIEKEQEEQKDEEEPISPEPLPSPLVNNSVETVYTENQYIRPTLSEVKHIDIKPLSPAQEAIIKQGGRKASKNAVNATKIKETSSIANAVIASLAFVACAVAFVGTGFADKYISASVFHSNRIVSFLEGKSVVER